jgi:hypothetical protein
MRTLVTNTSGVSKFFGFVPPHGAQLANGAAVTLEGDLATVLAGGRNRFSRKTELASMRAAIANGDATIADLPDTSSSSSSSA